MVKYTLKILSRNKLRSFLTALGVIIGVWAVILLVAIGNGLKVYIEEQFSELGTNLIFILPGAYFDNQGKVRMSGDMGALGGAEFNEKDVQELKKVTGVKRVAPAAFKTAAAAFGRNQVLADVIGSTADLKETRKLEAEKGRFFTPAEEKRGRKVVVLGSQIAEDLFDQEDPIEKKIEIDDRRFTVIGVLEKKGGGPMGGGGIPVDSMVYAPYKAVWTLTERKSFNFIFLEAENEKQVEALKKEAQKVLAERYNEEDFSIMEQTELLGMISEILGVLTAGLAGIAAISLIVGGVGIMNIMYVTVAEKTREIGLRKAIGATNKEIKNQFLTEAAILSLVGGIIGLFLSALSTLILNRFFPAKITFWSIGLALLVSTGVGIIFGLAPARRAAKFSPVEALRYE